MDVLNVTMLVWYLSLSCVTSHIVGRKSYVRLNARDGESISISNAAIGADTTESLKNAVSVSMTTAVCVVTI